MGTDFQRWRAEQRHAEAMSKGIETPAPARATVESDVVVPVLQAVAVAGAVGLGGGGFALLFGAALATAGRIAGGGFLLGLCGAVILFIFQHRAILTTPARVQWQKLALAQPSPTPRDDPPAMVIRPLQRRSLALPATLDHQVESIEPDVEPEIVELYQFITRTWPTSNVSRAHCRGLGFTRSTWERYVGGRRGKAGQESARGLLDRAGAVEKTPNGWEIVAPLDQALAINDDLHAYAEAKAQLVRPGRAGPDRTGHTR